MHSFFTVAESSVLMNTCKIKKMAFIRDGIHRTCSNVGQLTEEPCLDRKCVDPKTLLVFIYVAVMEKYLELYKKRE